jgi:molybdate/tungstate transport system permease protein
VIRAAALIGVALILFPVIVILIYGLPLLVNGVGTNGLFASIELTIFSSLTAAVLDVIILTPAAYIFSRRGSTIIDSLADLPASVPHPVIGIAIVLAVSPLSPLGEAFRLLGINILDTFTGLSIALVAVSAPIYYRSAKNYFESMPRAREEYVYTLGLSEDSAFVKVVMPQAARGILSSALVAMSRAMSEFGSIAIIAYYVLTGPIRGMPAPILIYNTYSYAGVSPAVAQSAALVLVGLLLELLIRAASVGQRLW